MLTPPTAPNRPPAYAGIVLLLALLLACGPLEVLSMSTLDGPQPLVATAHVEPRQTETSVLSSLLVTLQIEPAGQASRTTSQVGMLPRTINRPYTTTHH
jgi:hypothetical protein